MHGGGKWWKRVVRTRWRDGTKERRRIPGTGEDSPGMELGGRFIRLGELWW